MSGERRVFDEEFKQMSIELSGPLRGNSRTGLSAQAKELDIPPAMLYRWRCGIIEKGSIRLWDIYLQQNLKKF